VDVDRVTALLHQVVGEEILPRFRALAPHEIVEKATPGDPEDVVTAVDHRVEERLVAALAEVAAAPVVGEESVHARPELLDFVGGDEPLWLLDPIDGTKNFARGEDGFGLMLAWVQGGRARASWVILPARGLTYVAEEGGGCRRNGVPVRVVPPAEPPRGALYVRFMTPERAASLERALAGHHRSVVGSGCAAIEYTDIADGRKDFAIYHRVLPWDHAPGALLLSEAGGQALHPDGSAYSPRSRNRLTIAAASAALAASVRGWLPGLDP
jgi:fructose-1,6-bisphosphatase/inositol monophosphatase family enzyme